MRCARIIRAATAPAMSTRRRSTTCGRGPLLARDQRGTVDSPVDDLDHGDVRAPPRLPPLTRPLDPSVETWFRASLRTDTTSRASCSTRTISSRISRRRTCPALETLPRWRVRMAAQRCATRRSSIRAQLGDPLPYDIVHADRKNWLAAKMEVIEGIQSDSASALESMREVSGRSGTPVGGSRGVVPRGARYPRPPREHDLRPPLGPR